MSEEKNNLNARDIILTMFLKNNGDWNKTLDDIQNKVRCSEKEVNEALSKGYSFITLVDSEFPERGKKVNRPPFLMFYRGNKQILSKNMQIVGILNDRMAIQYSLNATKKLCSDIGDKATFIIMFGQKNNNEIIKHLLDIGASFIAVVPQGIDALNNCDKELLNRITEKNLAISSFPNTITKPTRETFLESIKLFSCLSTDMLIGSLTSKTIQNVAVMIGLQMGTNIYCVPYQIESRYINNQLIKDGAMLITDGEDIIDKPYSHSTSHND